MARLFMNPPDAPESRKFLSNPLRVAIVGGGPGGLMAAYRLGQRAAGSLDISIFEATRRLGGKILTATFQSVPVPYEAGVAELYDYSMVGHDPLLELVRDLGLSTHSLEGSAVMIDGQLLRTNEDVCNHFGARTLAALEAFQRGARGLIGPADYYDSDWREDNQGPLARQPFSELLQTVPDESARRYICAAVHSDLATEPHQTSAMYGLQNYLMNEPDYMRLYTIEGGIESLTRELAARIRNRVLPAHRVTHVGRMPDGSFYVQARHKDETLREEFDIVVVALPNNWLPAIQWGGCELSHAMHAHHLHYDYPAHYLRVSLLFQQPFWRNQMKDSYFMMDAFGGCCVYDETSRYAGSQFGVLGWLLAGEAALNLSNFSDSDLIAEVLDSLPPSWQQGRELLLEGRVHRWVGSVNARPGGYPAREPDSRHVPDPIDHPSLLVMGDYLFDSTLNGVLDSAEVIVEKILGLQKEWNEAVSSETSRV